MTAQDRMPVRTERGLQAGQDSRKYEAGAQYDEAWRTVLLFYEVIMQSFSALFENFNPLYLLLLIFFIILLFFVLRRPRALTKATSSLFAVDHHEEVRVERLSPGRLAITADDLKDLPDQVILSGSPDPDAGGQVIPLEVKDGQAIIDLPDPGRRAFIHAGKWVYAERLLPFEGITNFRDVGGYFTEDQKQVRWGLLYRSSYLAESTEADRRHLEALGIKVVFDLRTYEEVARHPDPLPDSIRHWHLPVLEKDPPEWMIVFNRHRTGPLFEGYYRDGIIDQGAATYGVLLRALLDEANRPALIHCSAGKDRAGVGVALLLSLLGVPRRTIFGDFSLSNLAAEPLIRRTREGLESRFTFGLKVEHLYPMLAASPNLLRAAFERIEALGGIEAYLTGPVGLAQDEIVALREIFLLPV